jgi:23S rRNA (uracil1939-C5)-methyltransferase
MDGYGVVKISDKIVFVPYLLLDEVADIEIVEEKKSYSFGRIVTLIEPSSHRVVPKCPLFVSCGGCDLLHMDEFAQKQFKTLKVQNTFRKLYPDVKDCLVNSKTLGYRNKVTLNIEKDFTDTLNIGFYEKDSHNIIDIDKCLLLSNNTHFIVNVIKGFQFKEEINFQIVILVNENDDQMLIKINSKTIIPSIRNLLDRFIKYSFVKGIEVNHGDKRILIKDKIISNVICDLTFLSDNNAFRQVNRYMVDTLYTQAIQANRLDKSDVLLDAYSGIGTLGLIASKYVRNVICFDISEANYNNALLNIEINNIKNARYYKMDANNFKLESKYSVLIVDPPRNGLNQRFIQQILQSSIQKIIYVSCDVETLVRDLNQLKKYTIESVQPVDMFPFTKHVEVVVHLTKKS